MIKDIDESMFRKLEVIRQYHCCAKSAEIASDSFSSAIAGPRERLPRPAKGRHNAPMDCLAAFEPLRIYMAYETSITVSVRNGAIAEPYRQHREAEEGGLLR